MEKTIKRKTTDGLIWNSMQKFASKGLQLLFSILIARILMPEDYGIIAIANLVISLSDVLIDSGFSKALIRKKEKNEKDYATVFWFNMAVSVSIYAIVFFIAPFIGRYYESEILTTVIRIISITLVVNALCGIQSLRLIIEMDFRKLAVLETTAMAIGGIVAFVLALYGASVWALVAQTLVGASARTLLIWFYSKWKPSFSFSPATAKQFFSFGSRLLLSDFLGRIYSAVFTLTIGKRFSPEQLGLYGKADAFSSAPSSFIMGPIGSVSFPAVSEIQSEEERMRRNYLAMVSLTSMVVCPVFLGLIAVAKPLVPVLLTETWCEMIPFFQILSISCLFSAFSVIPQNYLLIAGESRSILIIQIITRITGLVLLIPLSAVSLKAVCWDIVIISAFSLSLTLFYLKKKAGYTITGFIRSIAPSFSISLVMMALVMTIVAIFDNLLIGLLVGMICGILLYTILSFTFNRKQSQVFLSLVMPYLKKN